MISVDEARSSVLALMNPVKTEDLPIEKALNRVLRTDIVSRRVQPPFRASAMDGYAALRSDITPGTTLTVIGEAAAGHAFRGDLKRGECVRIFTGAPVPNDADIVIIQEDVLRTDNTITITDANQTSSNIRPAGVDFAAGTVMQSGVVLDAQRIALAAAMGASPVTVSRRPRVAIMATGDELVWPGEPANSAQIYASNTFGLAAQIEAMGAVPQIFPISLDKTESLIQSFAMAQDVNLIVTVGGVSVGDHDLVQAAADKMNFKRAFYKVAMRPGKPLMAGRVGNVPIIGLPGNPVSALVCGKLFLEPAVRALLGLPNLDIPFRNGNLTHDIDKNGPRAHFMRASIAGDDVTIFEQQDSSLLSILARANILAYRPPNAPPKQAGHTISYLRL